MSLHYWIRPFRCNVNSPFHGSKRPMFLGIYTIEMKTVRDLETSGSDYAVMQRFIPEEWNATPTYFDTILCDQYLTKCVNQTSAYT
jgi:hypothetical protein